MKTRCTCDRLLQYSTSVLRHVNSPVHIISRDDRCISRRQPRSVRVSSELDPQHQAYRDFRQGDSGIPNDEGILTEASRTGYFRPEVRDLATR